MSRKLPSTSTEPIHVVVTTSIGEKSLHKIAAVDPRIHLQDGFDLVIAEKKGSIEATKNLDAILANAEIIYGAEPLSGIVFRAPKLRWIQSKWAGVESLLDDDLARSKIILTNARGIPDTPVSEFVLHIMLMFVKNAAFHFQLKQEKRWERIFPELLKSKTLGIVGLGHIGRAVARLAKAFQMKVIASDIKRSAKSRYVDVLFPSEQLTQLLSESDFVLLSVPLACNTTKLIGKKELKAMKSTAYLINVSRGPVVDEEALIRALRKKEIAGAGLDVFVTEPLPPESKLWDLPNVIFSPHVAGTLATYSEMTTDLFCDNLKRYLKGERLLNRVNKKRGY